MQIRIQPTVDYPKLLLIARATVLAWLAAFAASSSQAALLAGFAASSRAAGSSAAPPRAVGVDLFAGAERVHHRRRHRRRVDPYQLSLRGVGATIVDRVGLCPAASGKAGGFLALDWNDGSPVARARARVFEMHERIAADVAPFAAPGAALGYRRLTCEAVAVGGGGGGARPASRKLAGEWADLGVAGSRSMGGEDTIAQVHPRELTHAMFAARARAGASLRTGTVEGVDLGEARAAANRRARRAARGRRGARRRRRRESDGPVDRRRGEVGAAARAAVLRPEVPLGAHAPAPRVLTQAVFFQGLGDPEVVRGPTATCTSPASRTRPRP